MRCWRCLYPIHPDSFMHDCGGLHNDQYVSRLENELERLGKWLTANTDQPGGKLPVDGAIELIGQLMAEVKTLRRGGFPGKTGDEHAELGHR